MKILFSTYSCEPGKGSESGIGWDVVRNMAEHHEVWAITRHNNAPAIAEGLQSMPANSLHPVYYDLPRWARFWKRGRRGVELYYYLWQIGAYFKARRLHREIGFDIVHHSTFARYWSPSFLSLLPVPFVWGPVGGGESAPSAFSSYFGRSGRLYEKLRDMARWCGEHDPFVRMTARRSALAYASTWDSEKRMRAIGARRIEVRSQNGLDMEDMDVLGGLPAPPDGPIRFLFVGRLLGWKGAGLAIKGFAASGLGTAELWLMGDGPERAALERLAADLGVAAAVTFWGQVPRSECFAKMGRCHVLVHPSLHDSGGMACVEALAARRPVVCLDLGGPGALVDQAVGIKVPANGEDQVVQDLGAAMRRLAGDAELRARLGEAGRQRIFANLTWKAQCAVYSRAYEELAAKHPTARQI